MVTVDVTRLCTHLALAKDMKLCEKELSNLGNLESTGPLSIWCIGGGELLSHVKKSTRDLSPKFSDIAEKALELVHINECCLVDRTLSL